MSSDNDKNYIGIKEIARRANVAIATVDRVIHNRGGVAKKTKAKIIAIMEDMDYQPNILARRLASKRIFNFATLIPKVSKETNFWKAPLNGIERAEKEVAPYGVKILKYFYSLNKKNSFVKQANLIFKNKIDGLLIAPTFIPESTEVFNVCKELKIPCVFINSDISELDNYSYFGPHLFQSGYLAGNLIKYLVCNNDKILILNIATEIDNHHHLLRKEEGIRSYFKDNNINTEILKADIRRTNYSSLKKALSGILDNHLEIKVIFVTNARVALVARYLEEIGLKNLLLIGYDFLEENINYLNKGIIDFLICQKPELQGYQGIMALHNKLIMNSTVEKLNYMPIDIITKENYEFYRQYPILENNSNS